MGYSTLLLAACICAVYVADCRSTDQTGRRLATRGTRKVRANYGIGGYLYGKRSQVTDDDILNTVSRQYMSIDEVVDLMIKDVDFATMVAKTLDRNGDGYVQVSDLM